MPPGGFRIKHRTVRKPPGNCKAAKTEMVWARDKIGRPNQSYITGNSRRQSKKGQAEKEVDRQHCGVDRRILRRDSSHGTQLAGVERADEEVRRDAPYGFSRS